MRKLALQFVVVSVSSLLLLSCEKENVLERDVAAVEVAHYSADELRTAFAKNLAVSLENETLRGFLKVEALKRFDGDYDILFNMVKNNPVNEKGDTFSEILSTSWKGEISLEEVAVGLPTLNILIPDLLSAPTELWDTKEHTPLVAVKNSEQHQEGVDFLHAYNSDGQQKQLSAFEEPLATTLVVESSERVVALKFNDRKTNARKIDINKWLPIFQEGNNQYYITSENFLFKETLHERNSIATSENNNICDVFWQDRHIPLSIPGVGYSKLVDMRRASATYNGYSDHMRERLYYGNLGDQPLKSNMFDRLQFFKFRSSYAASRAADGWADGDLELYCYVAHGGPESASFDNVRLTLTIPRVLVTITSNQYECAEEFIKSQHPGSRGYWESRISEYKSRGLLVENQDAGLSVRSSLGLWVNWSGNILNWSMHRYGDRLNFIFLEYDEGEGIEKTKNYSVGFNASVGKKDVWNVGVTGQRTGSTKITYTNNSDLLGEYAIEYYSDYFVMVPPIGLGDIEFVLATY